jgi:hypothetical protein
VVDHVRRTGRLPAEVPLGGAHIASSLRVFQKVLKLTDGMLDVTVTKTSDDGATVAKSQEILRSYNDAASRVQSIATKLGFSVGK